MRKQAYAGIKGAVFLIVSATVLFMICAPLAMDRFLELNEPIETSDSYAIDEISGSIVRIQDFYITNSFKQNDADNNRTYLATIQIGDQPHAVYMDVSKEMQGLMGQRLSESRFTGILEPIDEMIGRIEVTTTSSERLIEVTEVEMNQAGDFYYNQTVLMPALASLALAITFITFVVILAILVKKLRRGYQFKDENNYSLMTQEELTAIMATEPTFDNIWFEEKYLLVNRSFSVAVLKYTDVVWMYIDTYHSNGSTMYYIKLNDKYGTCTTIMLDDLDATKSVFSTLLRLMPTVVVENNKEIARDYKDDITMFMGKYNYSRPTGDSDSPVFSHRLTEEQLEAFVTSKTIAEIRSDFTSSKAQGQKNKKTVAFTLIAVLFAVIAEMGLILLSDTFVPNLVRDYFLASDGNPALSFLSASFYSIALNGAIFVLIIALFLLVVVKLCRGKSKQTAHIGQFWLIGIIFAGFSVILPFFILFETFTPADLYEIHQDIAQIKNDELSYTDVYINAVTETDSEDFFPFDYTETYNHYIVSAVDASTQSNQTAPIGYHFPWKVVPDSDTLLSDYDFGEGMDDSNQTPRIYRLYHTEHLRVITELEVMNG